MSGAVNRKDETVGKITLSAKTYVSSDKPIVPPIAKTPIFVWKDKLPDSSKLNLQLDIVYSYLESIANENVKGKVYSEDGKKITINNVRITGDKQGRLVVNAEVYGSFNGTVLIKGKPYYDDSKQVLKATDVDVSIKTGNILHSAAAFLMKGKIKSEISKMLEFSLQDKIVDIQRQTDAFLADYSTKNNVKASAKLGSMRIAATVAEDTRVRSLVSITFYLHTYMENLSYFRQ
jgi:hypothetical protein